MNYPLIAVQNIVMIIPVTEICFYKNKQVCSFERLQFSEGVKIQCCLPLYQKCSASFIVREVNFELFSRHCLGWVTGWVDAKILVCDSS